MTEEIEVVEDKQLPALPPISAFLGEQKQLPASVEIESQRVTAEVKASVAAAKFFPRDEMLARRKVLEACRNPKLAERGLWKMPRGAGEISGPSIRLAETIARCWGNLDYGLIEHGQYGNRSQIETFCWDKEANNRKRILFDVPHIRFSNDAGENQKVLKDPAKIYEVISGAGQRRVRDCIIASVPNDLVEDAIAVILATRRAAATDLGKLAVLVIQQFATEFAIPPAQIEAYFGRTQAQFTEADLGELRDIYTALKDGLAKPSDYFQAVSASAAAAALTEKPAVKPAGVKPAAAAVKPAAVKPAAVKPSPKPEASAVAAPAAKPATASVTSTNVDPKPTANTAATSAPKTTEQADTKDVAQTVDPASSDPKPSASTKSSTEPSTGSPSDGGTEDPKPEETAATAEDPSSTTEMEISSPAGVATASDVATADTPLASAASQVEPAKPRKRLWK